MYRTISNYRHLVGNAYGRNYRAKTRHESGERVDGDSSVFVRAFRLVCINDVFKLYSYTRGTRCHYHEWARTGVLDRGRENCLLAQKLQR